MELRGIIIRLFPNKIQNIKLWQFCGTYRWCWNWGLPFTEREYKREGRHSSYNELSRELTRIRNSEGYSWLLDISQKTEQNALRDVDKAYKNFRCLCEMNVWG